MQWESVLGRIDQKIIMHGHVTTFKVGERVKYDFDDAKDYKVNTGTLVGYVKKYMAIVRWDDGSEGPCPEQRLIPLELEKKDGKTDGIFCTDGGAIRAIQMDESICDT